MKILGLIPARGGSKGIPGKNIKLLNNKPLLQYTTDLALRCKLFSKVIVSSDDDRIIKVAKDLGVSVPFKRPSNLAQDTSSTLSTVQHALSYFKNCNEEFDAVCILQVTSPFRSLESLNNAIQKFISSKSDSLISVREVPHEYNPHWTFEVDKNDCLKVATGETQIITRRQELPKAYHRDGCIYITKTATILNNNSLYGDTISYIESSEEMHINLDTMDDWKKAVDYLKKR